MAGYRDDLKGNVRNAFREANPDAFGKVSTLEATRQLRSIEERSAKIREKLREHCKRHEERWVAQVADRIFKRRVVLANDLLMRGQDTSQESTSDNQDKKKPDGQERQKKIFLAEIKHEDLIQTARKEVRARINKRLSRVGRITRAMRNAVVRNSQQHNPDGPSNNAPKQSNNISQKP